MDYTIYIKALVINAKNEEEAKQKALRKLKIGFKIPEIMIDKIEESEVQFI